MGMDIEIEDVRNLMEDNKFMDAVVAQVLQNKEAVDDLAEDVADALEDAFGEDETFRQKLIAGAMGDKEFREKVTHALVAELSD